MRGTLAQELAEHVPRMYRVALRMVGSADEAQEVAQDACVKALRAAGSFDGRAAVATWLHRIAVNCAHDHLRKRRRIDGSRADGSHDALATLAMPGAGPEQCAEQNEACRRLLALVAKLPDECRSAFTLTQLDGYTYDEAAAIEQLARGTVATRVHRARQILMEQVNHYPAGDLS